MSKISSDSAEDQAILQQVPALCDLLSLKRKSPNKLLWQDKVVTARRTTSVPANYLYVDRRHVTLAKRLQGLLSPEEWKPLLGSVLLVRSWEAKRSRKATGVATIIGVIYYVSALSIATQSSAPILGTFSSGLRVLLFFPAIPISLTVFLFWLFDRRSGSEARKDFLRADLRIADVIGRDQFLAVLHKIDNMGYKDEQRFIPRGFRSRQPSIKERIQNLQVAGELSSSHS